MRRQLSLIIPIFIILIPPIMALCEEDDGGPSDLSKLVPYIAEGGITQSDSEQKGDFCVDEEGGLNMETESLYLREFYCRNGIVKSIDVMCMDFGYTKCRMENGFGACVNKVGSSDNKDSADASKDSSVRHCGNKRVEVGEDCDPPDRLCVAGNGNPGVCSPFCTCIEYAFGDGEAEDEPEPKESEEKINISMTEEKLNITEKIEEEDTISPETKQVLEEIGEEEPLKLNETTGIKLTRGVTEIVKHLFGWIINLFH